VTHIFLSCFLVEVILFMAFSSWTSLYFSSSLYTLSPRHHHGLPYILHKPYPLLHSSQSFYPSYRIRARVFMGMEFIEACLSSSLACCPDFCGLVSIASIVALFSSYLGANSWE
jgi:hypothetical protein